MNTAESNARSRRTFWTLVGVFFGPILAAVLLYFALPELRPSSTTNYGTLVSPARPLANLQLSDAGGDAAPEALRTGKWSLVYLGAADCDEACSQRLILSRQVRLALGKDLSRVQRVYLAPDAAAAGRVQAMLAAAHADLRLYVDHGLPGQRAADFFQAQDAHALYLLDPLGNWLMVYTGEVQPKGLHGDLKKLLRVSSIG